MSYERLKTFLQTLRFRLTLWNTAVVLVLLVANLAAVHTGLELTRSQMVDEFLTEEMYSAALDFQRQSDKPEELRLRYNHQATGHPRRRLFVQLLDEQGRLAWSSKQSPPPEVLPASALAIDGPETLGELRFLCRHVALPDGRAMTLRVGCWLGRSQMDMARFTTILLAVGLVLLLVAPLGGYLLAYRATQPIARIIHISKQLQPAQLEERLPLRGTHDELDQLSQTINHLLDRIADYLRQSREFTANAAHELRSPLTALQSSLEIALNSDRSTEEYKEVLSVLLEECGQMRVLVNQLLFLAEGDAGRLRLHSRELRLDQIIVSSQEMFQVVAEAAEVELVTRRMEPVLIHGDGNRLWQVVNNLLDNAVKFTPKGGRVSLDFFLDEQRQQAVLEVADTGAGIAPEDVPHVFERFYQGDKGRQRENPSRGLGLGLSICQAVVAAHGGTIELASTPGKGTTFTVHLAECRRPPSSDGKFAPSAESSADGAGIGESV